MRTEVLVSKLKGRDHLEDENVDGTITLKRILNRWDGSVWTGVIWLRIWQVVGFCEHSNESSGSINGGDLLSR